MTRVSKLTAWLVPGVVMGGVAACQTSVEGEAAAPTIEIEQLAYTIRNYRGQTVRVCGRLEGPDKQSRWRVVEAGAGLARGAYVHGPPTIFVFSCPNGAPRLDREGCIAGRVVPRDESVLNPPGGTIVESRAPVNDDWYLQPQCPATG